eukprot:3347766-Pleurochrysis_carterae.AAC.2
MPSGFSLSSIRRRPPKGMQRAQDCADCRRRTLPSASGSTMGNGNIASMSLVKHAAPAHIRTFCATGSPWFRAPVSRRVLCGCIGALAV